MKVLDLVSSNSGNTFQKMIALYFNLYSSLKNDSLAISFGDNTAQSLKLNSSSFNIFFMFSINYFIVYLICKAYFLTM